MLVSCPPCADKGGNERTSVPVKAIAAQNTCASVAPPGALEHSKTSLGDRLPLQRKVKEQPTVVHPSLPQPYCTLCSNGCYSNGGMPPFCFQLPSSTPLSACGGSPSPIGSPPFMTCSSSSRGLALAFALSPCANPSQAVSCRHPTLEIAARALLQGGTYLKHPFRALGLKGEEGVKAVVT